MREGRGGISGGGGRPLCTWGVSEDEEERWLGALSVPPP